MLNSHDRAFKEWAFIIEEMKAGRQTVLIRKGGIREEDGIFRVNDPEFFLMPTFEHQNPELLQPAHRERFEESRRTPFDPSSVTLSAYGVVDAVRACDDEDLLRLLAHEHVWNERYLQMRLNFNPYDPLFVMILRVYNLADAVTLPLLPDYGGCKSWVTLERPLSTAGATPALTESEFSRRRAAILDILDR